MKSKKMINPLRAEIYWFLRAKGAKVSSHVAGESNVISGSQEIIGALSWHTHNKFRCTSAFLQGAF